jgi:hypothetical protein
LNITDVLLSIAGIAILTLLLGPGVVGAFDGSCWFLTSAQCTGIQWTDGRLFWAIVPWLVALFIAIGT